MVDLDPDALLRLRALVRARRSNRAVTALPGALATRARGRGLETADLRSFAHGDDPRHIDRNATARTGVPHVRSFHAERDRTTLLIADFRPSMLWGTRRTLRSVAAAEALCLAGWQTVTEGGRVGLIAVSYAEPVFQTASGRDRGMVAVIGAMARAHAAALAHADAPDPALSDALAHARRIAPRGAEVLVATALDNLGDGFEDQAEELRRRTRLSVLRIADHFETDPPTGLFRYATAGGDTGAAAATLGSMDDPLGLVAATYHAGLNPDAQPRHG
ncbi:MAG: DUF58 domain-containing protein [Pseudomonadota bacterium]